MSEYNIDLQNTGIDNGLVEIDSFVVDEIKTNKNEIVESSQTSIECSDRTPTNCDIDTTKNEKSPELFLEDDLFDESAYIKQHTDASCGTLPLINNINQREQEMLRRMKLSLSGLPPPPSVTIIQLDVISAMSEYKDKIYSFFNKLLDRTNSGGCINRTLLKSSHSCVEVSNMDWPNILNVNHHGVCFNLSATTEKIEYLNLSLVERFIGAETSSSFVRYYSQSSTNKRITETRMLLQSPSTRLSHLAKRRATFSSANILSNQTLYGCNKQIILESKKSEFRKEPRIITPRDKLFDRIKIGEITSTSKAAKTTYNKNDYPISGLHQDSLKKKLLISEISFNVGLTNREKSKRALFSQSDIEKSSSQPMINPISTITNDKRFPHLCLKRKRCEDVNDNGEEIDQTEFKAQAPRTFKYKSHSFCEATSKITRLTGNPIFRTSSDTKFHVRELSENHKKKLLWAVSQALQNKQITVEHPNFKQYASILARIVKRIFLELPKRSGSASDIMLSLAKKYAYCVTQGKTIDQLYSYENINMGKINSKVTKLSGYITPEEFEKRKKVPNQLFAENSINTFGISECLVGYNKLTSKSPLSELSQTNNNGIQEGIQINQQKKNTLSSSKNNLNGAILRENVDVDLRGSSQKMTALMNVNSHVGNMTHLASRLFDSNALKAKRQILFDK